MENWNGKMGGKMSGKVALHFSTIDLDEAKRIWKVLKAVSRCPSVEEFVVERSPSRRGWHVTLWCSEECEKCRERFDDPNRRRADLIHSKPKNRNVLFCKKERHYAKPPTTIMHEKFMWRERHEWHAKRQKEEEQSPLTFEKRSSVTS